ncbi:MAG: hypothetical protein HQ536_01195 [Parcubacteria group bacterium]|nr:hypothetical protein [Parcubacteria group bacterium]
MHVERRIEVEELSTHTLTFSPSEPGDEDLIEEIKKASKAGDITMKIGFATRAVNDVATSVMVIRVEIHKEAEECDEAD